ncbi:CASP-like protein 4A3 [Tanacetum coccineum]|uniref:CASP-like protein 4A3 n=1 Tax=Tanacetum coccineum TaxID=301880 RepID=A0ABQ4WQX9_9ASTR
MRRGKAKVSWESICLSKNKGGLGIHRLEMFNVALITSHIWSILTLKESLWVKWIHTNKLRGRNFWDYPLRGNMTWGWRKILQIRPTIRKFFWYKIGNGSTIFAWFDNWSPICPLMDSLTVREIHSAGFNMESKLADITSFSVGVAWDDIRPQGDVYEWTYVVWFAHCIPRHAFHLWLVIQRKLKTQDRLRQWDVSPTTDLNLSRTVVRVARRGGDDGGVGGDEVGVGCGGGAGCGGATVEEMVTMGCCGDENDVERVTVMRWRRCYDGNEGGVVVMMTAAMAGVWPESGRK